MNWNAAIAAEGKTIYDRIAEIVCRPGMSRKQMDNLVSKALKGYALWRTRACRLGEAGPFSAAAIYDLQQRYQAFLASDAARVAHERTMQAVKRQASEPEYVRLARADYIDLKNRIAALEKALRLQS